MKYSYHVALNITPERRRFFEKEGLKLEEGFDVFTIEETDEHWERIKKKLEEWKEDYLTLTSFDEDELNSASWLRLGSSWTWGYPQFKQNSDGYLEVTFNGKEKCPECWGGMKQIGPFWMKKEPPWGKKGMLQLNWAMGHYFVKTEVYKEVFETMGVKSLPVLNSKGDSELKTVVQLVAEEEASADLDGFEHEVCSECKVKRYSPAIIGFYPALKTTPREHICKLEERFGSGGQNYHPIIISGELYRRIKEYGVQGAGAIPLMG